MKYKNILDKISLGKMSRSELQDLRNNALTKFKAGDDEAMAVVSAIDVAKPKDTYILFMGFCPDADIGNRVDIEWKAQGICTFNYPESTVQVNRFNDVNTGDLVVLKKNAELGKTMTLHGHGRVTGIAYDDRQTRYLRMQWSAQTEVITVPAMAATSTVNIKAIETVEEEMPEEFFTWLGR